MPYENMHTPKTADVRSDHPNDEDIKRKLPASSDAHDDGVIGGAIGLIGGAAVGAAAGGPLGAVIGAVLGAVAADASVEGVIRRTHGEADEEEHLFSNHGASTPDFDAETGVTTHDSSLGDISVTDHTIFGSNSNEVVDEATAVPPRYRSVKPNE